MSKLQDILKSIVAPEHPWYDPDKAVETATNQILDLLESKAVLISRYSENHDAVRAIPLDAIKELRKS